MTPKAASAAYTVAPSNWLMPREFFAFIVTPPSCAWQRTL